MSPHLRKLTLTTHVTLSVGWLGAVVAYLALAVAGLVGRDAQTVRAAYLAMELIGWFVIVPCSLGALLTGLAASLGTEWGLFRHYWILSKLVLTTAGTIVLLMHMPTVSRVAGLAAATTAASADLGALRIPLVVHAGGGLLLLLVVTVLSVYKPWGRTRYGRREQEERRKASSSILVRGPLPAPDRPAGAAGRGSRTGSSPGRHVRLGAIGLAVIVVLHLLVLHLAGGGFPGH